MNNNQLTILPADESEHLSAQDLDGQIQSLEKAQTLPMNAPAPMARNEKDGIEGTHAVDADPLTLRNTVKVAIIKAHISMKRKYTVTDAKYLVNEVTSEIKRAFPGIRLGEIGLAIHKMAMGELGKMKFYSMSSAEFVTAIREYVNSGPRQSHLQNYLLDQNKLLLPEARPSQEQIEKKRLEIVLQAFSTYKNLKSENSSRSYNDHGNYIFDSLANYGCIGFTEEQKVDLWKEARKRVCRRLILTTGNREKDRENKETLKEVQNNNNHDLIMIEAKKVALALFFDDLIDMDRELSDLLNPEI